MHDRIRRTVFSLIVAMFLASSGSSTGSVLGSSADESATIVADCPNGTHWDSATGTCR